MLEVYLSIQLLHQSNVSRYWVHSEVLLGAGVKCKAVSHLLAFGVCPVEGIDVCACGEKSGSYRMHITSFVAGELFTQRLSQQAHLVEFKKWHHHIIIHIHQTHLNYLSFHVADCSLNWATRH